MSGNIQTNENLPGGGDSHADEQQKSQTDLEKLARSNGWRPKSEFRGVGEWVDASEYLRRNEEHLPIIKGRLKKTEAELAAVRSDNAAVRAELAAAAGQIAESRQATLDIKEMLTTAEDRAYRRAVAELNTRMDTAIAEGDVAAATAARKELENVTDAARERAAKATVTKKTDSDAVQPRVDPAAKAWISAPEQSWYREIPGAKGWAEQMFVDAKFAHLGTGDRLAKISELAPKYFSGAHPEHFKTDDDGDDVAETAKGRKNADAENDPEKPAPRRTAAVGAPRGTQPSRANREPTFEDIPREDQLKYQAQAREIEEYGKSKGRKVTFTKEEYLAGYKAAGGFDRKD